MKRRVFQERSHTPLGRMACSAPLCLRGTPLTGFHGGQSLVIALSVMFLMVFIGALFVTLVARNLSRVERTSDTAQARFLAEAGVRYADRQLTYSDQGADWRPGPQWLAPAPTPAEEAARQRHPDYLWLTDNGTYERPWASFDTGEGRFLLRVTYEPTFRRGRRDSPAPDEYDTLSGYLHIEAIGRPGVVDINDPTTLAQPNNPNWRPGQPVGPFVYLQAYKPIGITDQLWWVTNRSKARGPAELGVPPYEDGTGRWVRYVSRFPGGLRSNVDVDWLGDAIIGLSPQLGDSVTVAGRIDHLSLGSNPPAQVVVNLFALGRPDPVSQVLAGPSDQPTFPRLEDPLTGRLLYADNRWFEDPLVHRGRAARYLEAPQIDLLDPTTRENRYRRMTRDTGPWRRISLEGETQTVNLGWYGYGQGIYVDNFADIQYENDRDAVMEEWLRRGKGDVALTGWVGGFYTPSVRESGTVHPILEVTLTPDGIWMTRADRDVRGRNFGEAYKFQTRLFYGPNPQTGAWEAKGTTHLFPYPQNGVLFAEGSLRIKGVVGRRNGANGLLPEQLTVVSGGTIYIEGSLTRGHPASRLALLARDYVCLNPTQFLAVTPGEDVTVEADTLEPDEKEFHFVVPQNKEITLSFQWSGPPLPAAPGNGVLLHLQHSGGYEDQASRTDISLYINGRQEANRYDFAAYPPPYPPTGSPSSGGRAYEFFFFPPGQPANWWQSNAQSSRGMTVNWERKSFWIPAALLSTTPGAINTFRIFVEPAPGGQPYWLSRAAITPYRNGSPEPLPVRVQALIYAQNGSWFVIPPPWFNEDTTDLRDQFVQGDPAANRPAGFRSLMTFPRDTEDYPFFHEPLNLRIMVEGAIAENMPVSGETRARWIQRLWLDRDAYALGDYRVPNWYRPEIQYDYDESIRFWVRTRNLITGDEGYAYAGPPQTTPAGVPHVRQVRQAALARGQNIVTLPMFPRLPTGALFYAGNPL